MSDKDFLYFRILKNALAKQFREKYPEIRENISDWKGKDILLFQQDLENSVSGRISEKSFYTHFKSETEKIPRIDVLNLLSEYVGHEDWLHFKKHHQHKVSTKNYSRIVLAIILVLLLFFGVSIILKPKTYTISVIDAYSNKYISPDQITITQLFDDQSPREIDEIDDSIFTLHTTTSEVKFIVEAPYFHKDTVMRKIRYFDNHENIRLFPNDYALIIHSLSRSEKEDWARRRLQLSTMIAENARIIQVNEIDRIAIEIYNKSEFINRLTLPVNSLKNIEIINIRHENDQISEMRFIQKKGGKYE